MSYYTVKKDWDICNGEIVYHGILPTDLDRSGLWGIYELSRIVETSRLIFVNQRRRVWKIPSVIITTGRQRIKIMPGVYDDVDFINNFKPRCRKSVSEISRKSMSLIIEIFNAVTGVKIGENVSLLYGLDKTGRPIDVRTWWSDRYSNLLVNPPRKKWDFRRPSRVFSEEVIVRYSDMNPGYHVSNYVITMYCIDTATSAAISGFYSHFRSDMSRFPVLEMELQLKKESRAPDKLTITTWQNPDNIQMIYFELTKDSTVIARSVFTFDLKVASRLNKKSKL